ncbi:MAG: Na/Pi cotransporter family protein [Clostridia bacterium]|jgi:phosphate:Na+ symporter|nr:Na/Pi cotransporter family protein [Clostridia bacterium]MCI9085023.1 Na/Pi cotransporter family protein [Clostridia bacterium]
MDIFKVFSMCGGLALFLYGMNVMGDGLKKLGGGKLELILEKLTSNRLMGVLLGAVVTAVIQSSSATTVMVVGFVNSGIMKLTQSIGVMMGANIGTTVTAWILSLSGVQGDSLLANLVKPENFTPVLALLGIILLMTSKTDKRTSIGNILIGFAVLMFGMETMSESVSGLKNSPAFANMLIMFRNPVLGLLVGTILTAIIQSSSASVGILQALSATGQITFGTAIPILMGQNIGTCITAMISCIGTSKNAKRAAIANLYIKIISAVLFMGVFYAINAAINFAFINSTINAFNIAVIHTAFNVASTLVLLPCSKLIEKLVRLTIKEGAETNAFGVLDDRFLLTPSFAVEQCMMLATNMAYMVKESFTLAQECVAKYSEKNDKKIIETERLADEYEDALGEYLVRLSEQNLTSADAKKVSILLHAIADFEKMTDYTADLVFTAREKRDKDVHFSEKARQEITIMVDAVSEIIDLTISAFSNDDVQLANQVEPLEDVIDRLRNDLKNRHIKRMQEGRCSVNQGFVFTDYITALEKVSDHCANVAAAIIELNDDNYDIHNVMSHRKSSDEYKKMCVAFSKKYALPFSASAD